MKTTIVAIVLTLMTSSGFKGCSVRSETNHNLFTFDDITYRSWSHAGNENGTDIVLTLKDVDPGIEFISVTFRGIEIPLVTGVNGNKTIIKGRLVTGESLIDNEDMEVTKEKNNLKYFYNGIEYKYPLKNVRRLPTEIKGNQGDILSETDRFYRDTLGIVDIKH